VLEETKHVATIAEVGVALADWQVTPPAATVNRTVAVFAPVVDVLKV
jgi:hypothetical protein